MATKKPSKKQPTATRVAVEEVAPAPVEVEEDVSFDAAPPDRGLAMLAELAQSFKQWRPAREVLTRVRAVPTIFVQYDRATRVGGHPIERFAVVHGPSGAGKTSLVHGLGLSFLRRNHFYAPIDAEYTSPSEWLTKLLGEHADHPGFLAKRPQTYEECVDAVRELVKGIAAARAQGKLPDETSALIVVDSLRKLVPEDVWAKIQKHGAEGDKGSVDGMGGRAAQIRAALNAAWLDELTPLLYHTGTAMIAIARESEDVNADTRDRMYGNDWKLQGGRAIEYDSSLVLRVSRAGVVKESEAEDSRIVGTRHKITVRKTKVSGQDEDRQTVCFFHVSNGAIVPEGFDRARDVLELARAYKIVEGDGWLKWHSQKWQGKSAAVRKLTERPDALAALEAEVRARFSPDEALPEDEVMP